MEYNMFQLYQCICPTLQLTTQTNPVKYIGAITLLRYYYI